MKLITFTAALGAAAAALPPGGVADVVSFGPNLTVSGVRMTDQNLRVRRGSFIALGCVVLTVLPM
mgnify:CR=1 FL=1